MRAALITTGSVLLTAGVIGNAFYQKKQFYPSVVYIIKSNPSMAAIYIQTIVLILLLGKLMRRIFFGSLRAAEMEHLVERAWYAVTETCLAFTVFRDDLNPRFIGLFAVLLFLKVFHWLADDRVDFMERSPNITILFHVRIVSLLTLLATCDALFVYSAYLTTISKGAGTHLVFGFEYAILLAVTFNILMKYVLHWIDLTSDNPWDEKAVYLLYTELVMGFIKVLLYLVFITVMIKFHNFPLFAIRPMYLSMRALKKALNDVVMSRRAIRNMNTLYPNATLEDLANTDNVCIICREEMSGNGASKKLPCNHIFHVSCLRSWFQRQQTCPTCRMDVLRAPLDQVNQQARQQNAAQRAAAGPGGVGGMGPGLGVPPRPNVGSNQNVPPRSSAQGPQNQANASPVVIHDEMARLMVQTFAQMFVQAMVIHLNFQYMMQTAQRQAQGAGQANSTQAASTNTPPGTSQPATTTATATTSTTPPTTTSGSSQTPAQWQTGPQRQHQSQQTQTQTQTQTQAHQTPQSSSPQRNDHQQRGA